MLKKIVLAIALAIPFVGAQAQSALKIGLVDSGAIIQAMPETTQAQTKVNEASQKYQAEFAKLQEEFKRLVDDFQAMKQDELQAIKDRKTREIEACQQKIATFQENAQQDLSRMQAELMGPIFQKLKGAIETVGKEGGYSLIQDNNPQLTFYYAAPVVDLTAQVKAKLGLK